jgi:phospholipid/cholesterol/gamma-HCH transport system substrate-binding protein
MERSPTRDFIVGLFVLAGIAAIAYLSISVGGFSWHGRTGLKLYAAFDETGSLTVRSPVVISGVRVGEISSISLDKDFRAKVEMNIDPDLKLPKDTFANIVTAGLLGDRFIELQPGGEDETLKPGDTITHTGDAVIFEKVIGQLIYGMSKGNNTPTTAPATGPVKTP